MPFEEIDGVKLPERNSTTAFIPGFDLINHRYPGHNCKWVLHEFYNKKLKIRMIKIKFRFNPAVPDR